MRPQLWRPLNSRIKSTDLALWTQASRHPHAGTSPNSQREDCYFITLFPLATQPASESFPGAPGSCFQLAGVGVGMSSCACPTVTQGEPLLVSLLRKKKIEKASMSQK